MPKPLGTTEMIPTQESHYKAFAHPHPLESHERRHLGGGLYVDRFKHEVYVLDAPEIGFEIRIDVTEIKRALAARKLRFAMFEGNLTQDWVDHVMTCNGVEEEYIARLKPDDLDRPGILAMWAEKHHTMIDGNHRLVRRWREGLKTFQYAAVILPDITKFITKTDGTELATARAGKTIQG